MENTRFRVEIPGEEIFHKWKVSGDSWVTRKFCRKACILRSYSKESPSFEKFYYQ